MAANGLETLLLLRLGRDTAPLCTVTSRTWHHMRKQEQRYIETRPRTTSGRLCDVRYRASGNARSSAEATSCLEHVPEADMSSGGLGRVAVARPRRDARPASSERRSKSGHSFAHDGTVSASPHSHATAGPLRHEVPLTMARATSPPAEALSRFRPTVQAQCAARNGQAVSAVRVRDTVRRGRMPSQRLPHARRCRPTRSALPASVRGSGPAVAFCRRRCELIRHFVSL